MATSEADIAAQLIERLLVDPTFRAEFRRDPASACRSAGLDSLADEMSLGAGKAMMTLDVRESKSSLAGVMMAAAMEGIGIYQFGEHVLPHIADVPGAVSDVLSRVNLPSIPLPEQGSLGGSPSLPGPPVEPNGAGGVADAATSAGGGGGGGGGAAAAAAAPPAAAPPAAVPPEQAADAAGGGKGAAAGAVPPEQAAAQKAADKIVAAESPAAKTAQQAQEAAAKIAEDAKDLPSASDLPSGGVAPAQVQEVGPGGAKVPEPAAAPAAAQPAPAVAAPPVQPAAPPVQPAPAPVEPAPAVPPEQMAPAPPVEVTGTGGDGGSAAAEALLKNKNLVLDGAAEKNLRDGTVDPRLVEVLGKLTDKHKIELSASSQLSGRGLDIARVDGEAVNSGSPAARELASEIADLKGDVRPSAVGSPFQIGAKGFVSDGSHEDHIHVAFDGPPPAADQAAAPAAAPPVAPAPVAPAPVVAPPAAAPPAAAPPVAPAPVAAPVAAAAAAPPEPKAGHSASFLAVKAETSKAGGKSSTESFMAVKQDPPPQAQAAVAAQAPAPGAGALADLSGVSDVYPGNDAPREQIAAWMGKMAEERGLPRELPVMASLVESGMKNLNFGDADSVGFYQMRVGIWNQGAYAGFPDKPELQVKWFLDQAEAVKKQRIANGQPIDDPHSYGDWIADVERPAEQYRGRYQLKLDEAEGLLRSAQPSGGGAAAGAVVEPPAAGSNGAAAVQPAPSSAPADQASGGGRSGGAVDPHAYGAEGTGGGASPETEALLHNKNIVFDSVGKSDLEAGRIDPRVVAVLTKLSHDHKLTISCMCSDHPKFTTGGSVSNHHFGRGADIAAVDGVPVNSSNFDAREIAGELSHLNGDYRPDEIGSPWAISGPGYFTDAAHQNHLHIGFKQEISSEWKPPADVASTDAAAPAAPVAPGAPVAAVPGAPAAVAAAVPGQPGAAAAAVEPPRKVGQSQSFMAVTADAAAKHAGGKGATASFFAVKPPVGPASALAEPGTAPAAVADAATATASGSSSAGVAALDVAKGELARGVHEEGVNSGTDVDKYLAAAGVGPGNPWCASFVTWSLEHSGHKMQGTGWAAVQTWVRNAEAGNQGLQIVSADQARPGDIVAYDWGGQDDFGSDGHIGFLASSVQGGKFTALEGNNHDAVMEVPRQMGSANIKFIRVAGGASPAPGGAAAVQPAGGAVQPAAAAVQPAAPVAPVAPAAPAAAVEQVQPGTANGVRGSAAGMAEVDSILRANGGDGAGAKALAAITEAKRYVGTPYQWGGSTPQTGFDCSGLMQWAYAQAGVQIPRVTYDQVNIGEAVTSQADLKPGDLIFFGDPKSPHHVAMSLGGNKFIHAPQTGEDVKISSLDEPYFKSEYAGARRIDLSGAASPAAVPAAAPVAAAAAAPAAPAIDPTEVAKAQAAVARDAAEARRGNSAVFMAVKAMETKKQHHSTVMFMKAIDPSQVKATASAAPAPAAAAAAAAPAPGAAPSASGDAAMAQAPGAPVPANELALADVGPVGDYPGDQAGQPQIAKWLADEAQRAGLPRELPVMASLVESGVRNVKGGDADSAGFFQMRVGIWDKGPYAGYRQDPNLQAKWFIDQALAVKRQAIQAGDVNFGKDPSKWGEWIADIERPAAPYRGRYQLRLDEARGLLR